MVSAAEAAALIFALYEAAAKPEPEHKDDFIVADASEITNAITKKRASIPLPKVSAPPQV